MSSTSRYRGMSSTSLMVRDRSTSPYPVPEPETQGPEVRGSSCRPTGHETGCRVARLAGTRGAAAGDCWRQGWLWGRPVLLVVALGHCRREGGRAAVPLVVYRTDAELHVVLGDIERDRGDVADRDGAGPVRRRGLPHHDFVPGHVGLGVGVPAQRGEVGAGEADRRRRVDLRVLGRAGRGG